MVSAWMPLDGGRAWTGAPYSAAEAGERLGARDGSGRVAGPIRSEIGRGMRKNGRTPPVTAFTVCFSDRSEMRAEGYIGRESPSINT